MFKHCRVYSASDVESVPDSVGLYAWYGVLDAGRKDWEFENNDGVDMGKRRLLSLLQRQSFRYASPPLRVHASSQLTASWIGELANTTGSDLADALQMLVDESDKGAAALSKSLDSAMLRELLVMAIWAAVPILASPLYVGISINLRGRLTRHVSQIRRALAVVARDPDARPRLLDKGKNFASRAVGCGFDIESLSVWTLDLEKLFTDQTDPSDARVIAESTEWLLNRWYRPILGKK